MCGITGIYAFNEIGRLHTINLQASNDSISHRGPDSQGTFTANKTGLAQRRLSIIDLSTDGRQPMTEEKGRYTIIFNGEIYNYRQLRQRLEKLGYTFNSKTDTEVLLKMYIAFGADCLNELHGFFAFAIYDAQEDSLFIARDRMGIKPLVYYLDEDKLLFASEVAAILAFRIPKEIDYTSLFQYFQLNYVPAPKTIFKNVYKLLPGHYMKVKGRDIQVKQFYEPTYYDKPVNLSYDDAKKELIRLLEQSVEERMIADVPLGTFLSGGIDSSVVTALAAKLTPHLNTFSIGYKDEPLFDETRYAELVATKYYTNHTVFKLSNDDYFEHIFDMLKFHSEPFGDSSSIPSYILCMNTRKKVTVALSGDGADEIFAGYRRYFGEFKARESGLAANILKMATPILGMLPKTRNSFIGNKIRQLHRFAESMSLTPQERYWYLSSWMNEKEAKGIFTADTFAKIDMEDYLQRKALFLQHIQGRDINEILYSDVKGLLHNDMLHKVDISSMAHALEVRVPFLDHRIVNFAFSLPSEYKIDGKMKKKILQDAARHLLPTELYNRPKQGFDVPLARGYKKELKSWIDNDVLGDDFIKAQGIFSPDYIKQLKKTIFETNNFDQTQVWGLLAFQQWYKNFFL
jgi:asparagine synthase (glutamine-hydrolysing)